MRSVADSRESPRSRIALPDVTGIRRQLRTVKADMSENLETRQVDHPAHYNQHPSGVECIDVVETMTFNVGNAVKYLWRAGLKSEDAVTDLEKALWYVNREQSRKALISELLRESPLTGRAHEIAGGFPYHVGRAFVLLMEAMDYYETSPRRTELLRDAAASLRQEIGRVQQKAPSDAEPEPARARVSVPVWIGFDGYEKNAFVVIVYESDVMTVAEAAEQARLGVLNNSRHYLNITQDEWESYRKPGSQVLAESRIRSTGPYLLPLDPDARVSESRGFLHLLPIKEKA